jgi:uncharacterized damage-inducible protein DinB
VPSSEESVPYSRIDGGGGRLISVLRNTMTCYGANELAASLRVVRTNTVQIAEDIPEAQYGFRPTPDSRSVGELLAHIALGYQFQKLVHVDEKRTTLAGMDFGALIGRFREAEATLAGKAQIVEALKANGEAWASWVGGLSEDFLAERVGMPGEPPTSKCRFEMILSTKEHEMHHRGQLMLVERLLGIVPHLTRERQARMQPQK